MPTDRKLNPRTCRGCGLVFQPATALSRYGSEECKSGVARFQCRSVPGAVVTHPDPVPVLPTRMRP